MSLPFKHKGETVRVSLTDAFKSSRALQEERDALIRKRMELAENQKKFASALAQDKKGQAKTEQSGKNPEAGKGVKIVPPNPNIGSGPIITTGPPNPSAGNPPAGSNSGAPWTAEQDAELRHLKSQKRFTWKAAAGTLGKSESELKSRWNEINAKKGESGDRPDPEPAKSGVSGKENHEPSASAGKADNSSSKGTSKKGLYIDDNFTLEELLLLNSLASKYEDDKWLRISSRFYDKTGKRVSPQDAKKHVEQSQG